MPNRTQPSPGATMAYRCAHVFVDKPMSGLCILTPTAFTRRANVAQICRAPPYGALTLFLLLFFFFRTR